MQVTQVQPLGQEDPLEKEMATHSSILAWRIPRTEEPGRLQSLGSQFPNYTQCVWTQNCISTCMDGHILRLHQHWMGCWCVWAQEAQAS